MFNKNLEKLMQENGITNYRLSKLMHCSPTSVANWLNGTTIPKIDKMEEIANALGVPVSVLMGEKEKAPTLTDEDFTDEDILIAYSHADDSVKEAIRHLLKLK